MTAKPGYKTTEFWLTALATLIGLLAASGVVAEDSPYGQIIGLVTVTLAQLGYTASRGVAKRPPVIDTQGIASLMGQGSSNTAEYLSFNPADFKNDQREKDHALDAVVESVLEKKK